MVELAVLSIVYLLIDSFGFAKVMDLLNLKCHCVLAFHIGQFNLSSTIARSHQQLAQRVVVC